MKLFCKECGRRQEADYQGKYPRDTYIKCRHCDYKTECGDLLHAELEFEGRDEFGNKINPSLAVNQSREFGY